MASHQQQHPLITALAARLQSLVLDPRYHGVLSILKGMRNGIVYGTRIRFPHALVMVLLFHRHQHYQGSSSGGTLGAWQQRAELVLRATRQHARNLALYCAIYKCAMLAMAQLRVAAAAVAGHSVGGKEKWAAISSSYHRPLPPHAIDPFIAGALGGLLVFGRQANTGVAQQIVMYVFVRAVLAAAKLSVQTRDVHQTVVVYGNSDGAGGGGPSTPPRQLQLLGGLELLGKGPLKQRVEALAWPVFASLSWASVMWFWRWHPDTVQGSMRSSMNYIYGDSDHWDSLKTLVWQNK